MKRHQERRKFRAAPAAGNARADQHGKARERTPRDASPRAAAPRGQAATANASSPATGPKTEPAATGSAARSAPNGPVGQLYGVAPVLEALRTGSRQIEQIVIAAGARHMRLRELLELARRGRVPVRQAPRVELERATAGANHQGVVATIAAARYFDADELIEELAARMSAGEAALAVVLDGVEDPRNLGAILRTAECAGADGVFIPERRAVGLTETVAKAAAGALEHVRVARAVNLARLAEELKAKNIWTVGASADATLDYTDWDWTQSCALFLGGEGAGLHRLVREHCDVLVRIPLRGQIESLNVSVAAGIVLYEAVRQRTVVKSKTYKAT